MDQIRIFDFFFIYICKNHWIFEACCGFRLSKWLLLLSTHLFWCLSYPILTPPAHTLDSTKKRLGQRSGGSSYYWTNIFPRNNIDSHLTLPLDYSLLSLLIIPPILSLSLSHSLSLSLSITSYPPSWYLLTLPLDLTNNPSLFSSLLIPLLDLFSFYLLVTPYTPSWSISLSLSLSLSLLITLYPPSCSLLALPFDNFLPLDLTYNPSLPLSLTLLTLLLISPYYSSWLLSILSISLDHSFSLFLLPLAPFLILSLALPLLSLSLSPLNFPLDLSLIFCFISLPVLIHF